MNKKERKGQIGVTSENIFPIIKKFLYSDHDIFLRELVSNAVDATSKLQALSRRGEARGDLGDLKIKIEVDPTAKTLRITDQGVGMTADEIERYINQIAFSGAEDFLKKYEGAEAQIIGHFGLGFYSAFMVSERVEIDTLSYREGSEAVHWSCDGSPEFVITPSQRQERGTTITLHIDADSQEFLQASTIERLLRKYCRFLPIPIIFGKEQEWKDGKMQDTDKEKQINNTHPLWMKTPKEVTEQEYKSFYHELYPTSDDPLFHIHLNVDHPFTLKGVLYFPLIKRTVDPQRNRIHLYCNQVFVTEQVEDIVPEWLALLEGVIDSPDIPLNVSRSYLQHDANAKKITAHIGKKVADTLVDLFRSDRKSYEEKWESLGLFVQYGMLTEEKNYDRLKPVALLQDVEGKCYTFDEYKALVGAEQTDKEGKLVILYATDKQEQYVSIARAKEKGYNVLLMDGPLSLPFLHMLEEKEEKLHFARVDSDTLERLIPKESTTEPADSYSEEDRLLLTELFAAAAPKEKERMYQVETDSYASEEGTPAEITSNEWMRRMKDMSKFQSGMAFYDQLPDSYVLRLHLSHPLIENILLSAKKKCGERFVQAYKENKDAESEREKLVKSFDGKKEDELSDEQKSQRKALTEKIDDTRQKMTTAVEEFAKNDTYVAQVWDLALVARNLLSGDRMTAFLKRSSEMLLKKKAKKSE